MELIVTVVLVAVLASYSVYYYNNTIEEGKLHAAKGKLAALGGALERYKLEQNMHTGCNGKEEITASNMSGACEPSDDTRASLLNVFRCGYAEKSLGLDENFTFYFSCSAECNPDQSRTEFVPIMKPKVSSSVYPSCAYFDPVHDIVVEVRE